MLVLNTFIYGSELKFAESFVNKMNERLVGDEVRIDMVGHHSWDTLPNRGNTPSTSTDLILIIKSNINHKLRDWAMKWAVSNNVLWVECVHKVAVAENDIRKVLSLPIKQEEVEVENPTLAEMWEEIANKYGWPYFRLPHKWGRPVYEVIPYSISSNRQLVNKWDKIYFGLIKEYILSGDPSLEGKLPSLQNSSFLEREWLSNNGKSGYNLMLALFKKVAKQKDTLAYAGLLGVADAWANQASRTLVGRRSMDFAVRCIFGLSLNDLPTYNKAVLESMENNAPTHTTEQTPAEAVEAVETPMVAETPMVVEVEPPVAVGEVVETPEVVESTEAVETPEAVEEEVFVLFGNLKVSPADNPIHIGFIGYQTSIKLVGSIKVNIGKVDSVGFYDVTISK